MKYWLVGIRDPYFIVYEIIPTSLGSELHSLYSLYTLDMAPLDMAPSQ